MSTSNVKEPREFLCRPREDEGDTGFCLELRENYLPLVYPTDIHVIEYSAYEALQAQLSMAVKALGEIRQKAGIHGFGGIAFNALYEIAKLKENLK